MNRRDRRRLEREGKIPKSEPTYNMKPSSAVDSLLKGVGKDIMMAEIHKNNLKEMNRMAADIDVSVLWCLHEKYGWGAKRLKRFYRDLFDEHKRMRKFYEMDDLYPERSKLKEIGVDVEAWYNEFVDEEGNYRDQEVSDGI